MKKAILIATLAMFCISACTVSSMAGSSEWIEITSAQVKVNAVLVTGTFDKAILLAGTDKEILRTTDLGKTWRLVLKVKGVRMIQEVISANKEILLFACTEKGLFKSCDLGQKWEQIPMKGNTNEKKLISICQSDEKLFLGTMSGLFVSKDLGKNWEKVRCEFDKDKVIKIKKIHGELGCLFVASSSGVFRSDDQGKTWKKIFIVHTDVNYEEEEDDDKEEEDDDDTEDNLMQISDLAVTQGSSSKVYIATLKGVFESTDKGENWLALTSQGLLEKDVLRIALTFKDRLYAATGSGIFVFDEGLWSCISLRLIAEKVNDIVFDRQMNLYACCDKGLFMAEKNKERRTDPDVPKKIENIPSIKQVQQAAIKYAEVEPEKILEWRRLAAKKALLPEVSFDLDVDDDKTTASNIWGTYGSNSAPGKYFTGPDDHTRCKDFNFGISMSWDLSDLVWNEDQTSIDVRSRLMVQLRDDILDEVTKIYFERLRESRELEELSIEESKKRAYKELRIQELTAYLDGLTNNFFSDNLRQ